MTEDKRLRILQATQKLLTRQGYEHLTISRIAQECDIGKGTVYEYFDSPLRISGREKSVAHAVASGKSMEGFSGKNQDAADFDSLAASAVHRVHSDRLSPAPISAFAHRPLCGILYAARRTVGSDPWCENANADMDE